MRKNRRGYGISVFIPYTHTFGFWVTTVICGLLVLLITCAIMYFPVIKPNIEHQKSVVSKIEQGEIDYQFGDISEFSTHANAYLQTKEYDGKIVSFTGVVGEIRGISLGSGEYGDSLISLYSEITNEWCADCGINDVSENELESAFNKGDRILVIGEVYHSSWVIELRNCRIEHCE